MSYLILGAALELARYLGPSYAAGFLKDRGVSPDVVEELLKKEFQLYPPSARSQSDYLAQA